MDDATYFKKNPHKKFRVRDNDGTPHYCDTPQMLGFRTTKVLAFAPTPTTHALSMGIPAPNPQEIDDPWVVSGEWGYAHWVRASDVLGVLRRAGGADIADVQRQIDELPSRDEEFVAETRAHPELLLASSVDLVHAMNNSPFLRRYRRVTENYAASHASEAVAYACNSCTCARGHMLKLTDYGELPAYAADVGDALATLAAWEAAGSVIFRIGGAKAQQLVAPIEGGDAPVVFPFGAFAVYIGDCSNLFRDEENSDPRWLIVRRHQGAAFDVSALRAVVAEFVDVGLADSAEELRRFIEQQRQAPQRPAAGVSYTALIYNQVGRITRHQVDAGSWADIRDTPDRGVYAKVDALIYWFLRALGERPEYASRAVRTSMPFAVDRKRRMTTYDVSDLITLPKVVVPSGEDRGASDRSHLVPDTVTRRAHVRWIRTGPNPEDRRPVTVRETLDVRTYRRPERVRTLRAFDVKTKEPIREEDPTAKQT